jgi:molecular chaperone GrpE
VSEPDRNDRNGRTEHGDEPVVVRDRRRIDPVTGEVRTPAGQDEAQPAGAAPQAPDAGPDAGPEAGPDAVAAAELAAEVAERTADLQRVTAEYANYRRRVERDRESVLVGARVQFVADLLTVLDDLDRAEAHGDLTGPFKSVGDKLVAVVQKLGLEGFGLEGEPFDPSVHEAVQHESGDVAGPTVTVVASVLRRGYRIADRVLRPAMVTVADRPDELGRADGAVGESTDEPAPEQPGSVPDPDPAQQP